MTCCFHLPIGHIDRSVRTFPHGRIWQTGTRELFVVSVLRSFRANSFLVNDLPRNQRATERERKITYGWTLWCLSSVISVLFAFLSCRAVRHCSCMGWVARGKMDMGVRKTMHSILTHFFFITISIKTTWCSLFFPQFFILRKKKWDSL